MRFGFPIPNCREGRDNLTGFVGAEEIVRLSQECERLGYDTVWANDFINPPRASRERFDPPPSWYEVFTSLCAVAVKTEKITLGVGLIVMPFREPVILAKQAITLDHFSNGRLLLGLGLGGSRDEFVSIKPKEARAHRGKMLDEGLEAVARLLTQTEASLRANITPTGTYRSIPDQCSPLSQSTFRDTARRRLRESPSTPWGGWCPIQVWRASRSSGSTWKRSWRKRAVACQSWT